MSSETNPFGFLFVDYIAVRYLPQDAAIVRIHYQAETLWEQAFLSPAPARAFADVLAGFYDVPILTNENH